jgi:hypothetical protein
VPNTLEVVKSVVERKLLEVELDWPEAMEQDWAVAKAHKQAMVQGTVLNRH